MAGQDTARTAPKLTIRRATENDLAEVVLLERGTVTAPHWPAAEYAGMLGRGGASGLARALFVAAEARSVCGFAVGKVLRMGREVEGELESVVVHAGLRRQGLGSSLCRAVMEWARTEGAGRILLEVRAGSAGAVRLYGGLGFVAAGRRPRYYGDPVEDAVLMGCRLARRGSEGNVPEGEEGPLSGWLDV